MKTETILNTLILSLSVSTVLITLISYLIYKIRQFPKSGRLEAQVKRESTFFRRHVPGLVQSAEELIVEERKKGKLQKLNTLPFYFATIVVIIFMSLIFKDVIGDIYGKWQRGRYETRMHALKARGLFKMYDFESMRPNPKLEEVIPENLVTFLGSKIDLLKTKTIGLVSLGQSSEHASRSLAGWEAFFKKHGLTYKLIKDTKPQDVDVYVLPQMKSMTSAQEALVSEVEAKGKGLLFTGPCGTWCEKKFSLMFKDIKPGLSKPSLLTVSRPAGWLVPPGLLMDWYVEDESVRALAKDNSSASIFEAEFSGRPAKEGEFFIIRGQVLNDRRSAWLALEPHGLHEKKEHEVFYGEAVILETLFGLSGHRQVEVALWKDGHASSVILSVDAEDKIEGAFALWKAMMAKSVPGTFFIVSDQLKNDDRLAQVESPLIELGSHTTDHSILTDRSLDFQFKNIQESRLAIEEKSGRPVWGFHPPEEKFDETTLNAVLQNHFDYMVGDQRLFRAAPVFVDSGLVYYPRIFMDDFLVQKNRQLISREEIAAALLDDYRKATQLGGLYYFNSHGQTMGQGIYLEAFGTFLDALVSEGSRPWITTFEEMTRWWKQRSELKVRVFDDRLTLQNGSQETLKGLVLFVDGKERKIDDLKAGEERTLNY